MPITRRIYVSLPADQWLTKEMNDLKWALVDEIEKLGYVAEVFTDPRGAKSLAASEVWTPQRADQIARRCCGAVIIGMARWDFSDKDGKPVLLPTEFNHYEGAVAYALGLPTLVLAQADVARRVVLHASFGHYVGEMPANATPSWLFDKQFTVPFNYWKEKLAKRRDVFVGYCSNAQKTADSVIRFLESEGVSVLNWKTDFDPGRSILDQISRAAACCQAGIFLFTKDDQLATEASADAASGAPAKDGIVAAPRDNVIFEAGYFTGLKGKANTLIIREEGSKLPADLGGDTYAYLPANRPDNGHHADISAIEPTLKSFLRAV